jgi:hypothetical protein
VAVAAVLAATVAGAATLFDAGVEPSASAAEAKAPGMAVGLRAGLADEVTKPAGQGLVEWSASWQLTWEPVPGAVEYVIHAVGPEGEATSPMRTVAEPELTLTVAAGTTTRAALPDALRAQAGYRATQLGVTIMAVSSDGVAGPPTDVVPVGSQLSP